MEKFEPSYIAGGNAQRCNHFAEQLGSSSKRRPWSYRTTKYNTSTARYEK